MGEKQSRPLRAAQFLARGVKMNLWLIILPALLLTACGVYLGYGLKPGETSMENVIHTLGPPAMSWQNADGSVELAFPRGPMGIHTYMAIIGEDGKLQKIENVLDEKNFARVQRGMNKHEVLRILGPSYPNWTSYFERRDELVWEWRYCDAWNEPARFNVLFDNTLGTVRSTMSLTESQRGFCRMGPCAC
jgi:hypothetical protein